MTALFLIGDVFDRLAEIPAGTVELVLTSPPFLALRSYLPDGHPNKAKEIGSEPTPAEFIDTLLALTAEWGRVLAAPVALVGGRRPAPVALVHAGQLTLGAPEPSSG
jgi:hypothetical protein